MAKYFASILAEALVFAISLNITFTKNNGLSLFNMFYDLLNTLQNWQWNFCFKCQDARLKDRKIFIYTRPCPCDKGRAFGNAAI